MDSSLTSAIGIDLGTTFSLAAVFRKGKAECIPIINGKRMIPSFVFYHPTSDRISVGSAAENDGVKYPENFLYDMKRIIGRKFDDMYVQKLKSDQEYQFKIVEGNDNKVEIELKYNEKIIRKSPEEVSSEILRHLRKFATEYLGEEVSKAIISIPAYFSNAQRKATHDAGKLAGFKEVKFISEPVAAAVHYAVDRVKQNIPSTLLVFDFGGGTLDASIIKVDEKTFQVKSIEGDTFLGGRDFDKILLNLIEDKMIKKYGNKIKEKRDKLLRKIKKRCLFLKENLSNEHRIEIEPIEIVGEEEEFFLSMSRQEFENMTIDLVQKGKYLMEICLQKAGLSKKDITFVVLAGGSTRIPKVQEMLSSYFGKEKLKNDLNPDEAIALGAAIQAANEKDFEKYKVTEITPLSLGIGLCGNLFKIVIEKNSPYPIRSKPIKLHTTVNNQKQGEFKIYEGERKNCEFNNLLGSFTINDLPSAKAGEVQVEVTFFLDEDGVLEIEAHETSTEKKARLAVTLGEYRLCEKTIRNFEDDAKKNYEEDEVFEKNIRFKIKIERICNNLIYDLGKLPSEEDREFVEKKCKKMKHFLKNSEDLTVEKMQKEYKKFTDVIEGVVKNYIDINLVEDKNSTEILYSSLPQPHISKAEVTSKNLGVIKKSRKKHM